MVKKCESEMSYGDNGKLMNFVIDYNHVWMQSECMIMEINMVLFFA